MNKRSLFIVLHISLFFLLLNFQIAYSYDDIIQIKPANNIINSTFVEPIKLEARIDVPLNLSLEKALNIALQNNLNIVQAKYKQNIQKWGLIENIGNWLPDYRVGYSAQRFDGSFLIGGIFPVMTLTSNVNAFMRFDYRFFEGGKGFFNTLAAKNLYKSSKENFSSVLNDTLLHVTKAYNKLLSEQAKLDVLSKAVEEAKSELDLNQSLEKNGTGTKFYVLQSEAELAEKEQVFLTQESKIREASIYLASLLNLDLGTHISANEKDLTVKNLYRIDAPVTEIISVARKNRPELKQGEFEYNALRNNIGVAYSSFLPKANFFGQYGGTGNAFFHRTKIREIIPDAIALSENGNPIPQTVTRNRALYQTFEPQVDLSNITNVSNVIRGAGRPFPTAIDDSLMANKFLGIEVGWDILDGLGVPTISRINQARSQAKISKTNLEILNQKVEEEVRKVYLQTQTTERLLDVSKRRVNAATEALHLAKVRLENGVGINTELISAQKQYIESLSSQVDAIIEYNNSQAELLYSLGLISVEKLIGKG